ncbi:hypothetical protein CYMTET_50893, partial [Cymbomonas tetramitiformis]
IRAVCSLAIPLCAKTCSSGIVSSAVAKQIAGRQHLNTAMTLFTDVASIKLLNLMKSFVAQLHQTSEDLKTKYKALLIADTFSSHMIDLTERMSMLVVIGVGGALLSEGYITSGMLVSFVLATSGLNAMFLSITDAFQCLLKGVVSYTALMMVMLEEPETDMESRLKPPRQGNDVVIHNMTYTTGPLGVTAREISVRKQLALHRPRNQQVLSMSCFREPDAVGQTCLQQICLKIAAGSKVALVGRSGSGKTSLLKVLASMYIPTSGTAQIGGTPAHQQNLHDVLMFSAQDEAIFPGTVEYNIGIGLKGASRKAIEEAAKTVQLLNSGADGHWLVEGLDAEVGAGGRFLSDGQKQKLRIARLLLRTCPIVLLDEPTSHQDHNGAGHLAKVLLNLKYKDAASGVEHPCTTIIATHSYDLVMAGLDSVVVIIDGAVVEAGHPEELLARRGWLWRMSQQRQGLFISDTGVAVITPNRLRQLWPLSLASEEMLEPLTKSMMTRKCRPGEVLFSGDRPCDVLYLMVQGKAEEVSDDGSQVTMIEPGDVAGMEMLVSSVIKKRSKSHAPVSRRRAVCSAESTLLALHERHFLELLGENHELREVVEETVYSVDCLRDPKWLGAMVWLFLGLSEDSLLLLGSFFLVESYSQGFTFLNSNRHPCSSMYINARGSILLVRERVPGLTSSKEWVQQVHSKGVFGELCLWEQTDASGIVSAAASVDSIILRLPRSSFEAFMQEDLAACAVVLENMKRRERMLTTDFLRTHWIFAVLSDACIMKVASLLTAKTLPGQTSLAGSSLIFLMSGKVKCSRTNLTTMRKILPNMFYEEGDMVNSFGLLDTPPDKNFHLDFQTDCVVSVLMCMHVQFLSMVEACGEEQGMKDLGASVAHCFKPSVLYKLASPMLDTEGCQRLNLHYQLRAVPPHGSLPGRQESPRGRLWLLVHGFWTVKNHPAGTFIAPPGTLFYSPNARTTLRMSKQPSSSVRNGKVAWAADNEGAAQTEPVQLTEESSCLLAGNGYGVAIEVELGDWLSESELAQAHSTHNQLLETQTTMHNTQTKLLERIAQLEKVLGVQEGTHKSPRRRWHTALRSLRMFKAFGMLEMLQEVTMLGIVTQAEVGLQEHRVRILEYRLEKLLGVMQQRRELLSSIQEHAELLALPTENLGLMPDEDDWSWERLNRLQQQVLILQRSVELEMEAHWDELERLWLSLKLPEDLQAAERESIAALPMGKAQKELTAVLLRCRKQLVPIVTSKQAQMEALWEELHVPPASRVNFRCDCELNPELPNLRMLEAIKAELDNLNYAAAITRNMLQIKRRQQTDEQVTSVVNWWQTRTKSKSEKERLEMTDLSDMANKSSLNEYLDIGGSREREPSEPMQKAMHTSTASTATQTDSRDPLPGYVQGMEFGFKLGRKDFQKRMAKYKEEVESAKNNADETRMKKSGTKPKSKRNSVAAKNFEKAKNLYGDRRLCYSVMPTNTGIVAFVMMTDAVMSER